MSQVLFENEPGEGSGVLRSLFTAFADAVLSEETLPKLEALSRPRKTNRESITPSLSLTFSPSPSPSLAVSYSTAAVFKGKSSRERAKTSRTPAHPQTVQVYIYTTGHHYIIITSSLHHHYIQASVIRQTGRVASSSDVEPSLFYQPGKAGFYSLVQATPTPERLQVFRAVGRMVGLSLLLAELLPLPLCRHILKFIMMKEVGSTIQGETPVA